MNYSYICSVSYEKVQNFSSLIHSHTVKKIGFIALVIIAAASFVYMVCGRYFPHRVNKLKQEGNLPEKLKEIPNPNIKLEDQLEELENKQELENELKDWKKIEKEIESENQEEESHSVNDQEEENIKLEAFLPLNEEQILKAAQQADVKEKVDSEPDLRDWLKIDEEVESQEEANAKDKLEQDVEEVEPENKAESVVPVDIDAVEPAQMDPPLPLDEVKKMLSKRGDLQHVEGAFYLRNQKLEGEGKLEFLEPLFCVIEGRIQAGQLIEGKVTYKGPANDEGNYQWEEHVGDFKKARLTKGTITLSNGTIYQGTFLDTKTGLVLDGKGEITYSWGAAYKGEFVKGELRVGTVTLPGGIIYEGDFEGDILKKGTITLPGGYKKIGGYNQKGLFEGTLVYADKQDRQWKRKIEAGQISAARTQVNAPADQPDDQDIADDRRVDDSDPENIKEIIGEFTTDDEGALTGQGIVVCKRADSWWVEEGIFEDDKLVKGKATYYNIDEDNQEPYLFFELDKACGDDLQGRRMEWRYSKEKIREKIVEKIAIEIREGNFSLEDPDFLTILDGQGRTRSPEGNQQEGLFDNNELRQGRKIFPEIIVQEKKNGGFRDKKIQAGCKEEGFFLYGDLSVGQSYMNDKFDQRTTQRGKWTYSPFGIIRLLGLPVISRFSRDQNQGLMEVEGIESHYNQINEQITKIANKNRADHNQFIFYKSAFIDF